MALLCPRASCHSFIALRCKRNGELLIALESRLHRFSGKDRLQFALVAMLLPSLAIPRGSEGAHGVFQ